MYVQQNKSRKIITLRLLLYIIKCINQLQTCAVACRTKICQARCQNGSQQNIVCFHVPMNDTHCVKVPNGRKQLLCNLLLKRRVVWPGSELHLGGKGATAAKLHP